VRILHIFDHSIPLHSGYAFRSLAIIKEQRKLGYETYHLTGIKHYNCDEDFEEVDGLIFIRTKPTWRSKLPLLNQWDVIYTLKKNIIMACREHNIDIIHAHSPSLNALAAVSAAKQLKIPVVYEMRASWEDAAVSHGTCAQDSLRYKLGQWLEKKALRSVQQVTTICAGLAEQIEQWGVLKKNITIIPNGVDIEKFSGPIDEQQVQQTKAELKLSKHTVLGFLGSFYRYEGLHILIDALAKIVKQDKNVRLLLVGGGQEEAALKQQVQDLELAPYVIFTGRVPHDKIQQYYQLIDIFIYPRESIRLTEMVTPLKPLEAMAQHGLVVASDIGGHREMIQHQHNGILFKPDNVDALAHAIVDLINNQDGWPKLRQAGRDYVEQERCWQESVRGITSVYQQFEADVVL